MLKSMALMMAGVMVLGGCANEKAWTDYHSSIDKQTNALLQFSREQASEKKLARVDMMSRYSTAMSKAAETEDKTDDVILAFAWGMESAKEDKLVVPSLPKIEAPDKSSDIVRAWTPIAGMVVPFLYPLASGWGGDSGSTKITADNGGTVLVDSGNAGSYNRAGGDMSQTMNQEDWSVVDNCADGGCGESSEEELEAMTSGVEDPDVEPESCGESGGWYNNGTWWLHEGSTCSCSSREAGHC